jgi:2'-5' RNA ligase
MRNADLRRHYDAMWASAFPAIAGGAIDCDTRIAAGPDLRRGLTLIARPGAALQASFAAVLQQLDALEPHQYRYPVSDMHITILPLFTAVEDPSVQLARLDDYRAVVATALKDIGGFSIDFDGITLSPGAVMARGFPRGPALEALRERLRTGLRAQGLDASLDGRYRLVTAHVTLCRFVTPLRQPAQLGALLAALRDRPLGRMRVDEVELVINDWYMSTGTLQCVGVIPLQARTTQSAP